MKQRAPRLPFNCGQLLRTLDRQAWLEGAWSEQRGSLGTPLLGEAVLLGTTLHLQLHCHWSRARGMFPSWVQMKQSMYYRKSELRPSKADVLGAFLMVLTLGPGAIWLQRRQLIVRPVPIQQSSVLGGEGLRGCGRTPVPAEEVLCQEISAEVHYP